MKCFNNCNGDKHIINFNFLFLSLPLSVPLTLLQLYISSRIIPYLKSTTTTHSPTINFNYPQPDVSPPSRVVFYNVVNIGIPSRILSCPVPSRPTTAPFSVPNDNNTTTFCCIFSISDSSGESFYLGSAPLPMCPSDPSPTRRHDMCAHFHVLCLIFLILVNFSRVSMQPRRLLSTEFDFHRFTAHSSFTICIACFDLQKHPITKKYLPTIIIGRPI